MESINSSTPDNKKLSTQFSSGKEDRRDSDQYPVNGFDGSKTFISSTDHHAQMSAMEDRIAKLENLVWNLYKELNGKIENTTASTQIQLEEMTAQMRLSQPLKAEENGYEASDEENCNANEQKPFEDEGEDLFIQGSLDRVEEELSSQYYSQEEKDEFSRNTFDRSEPQVSSARDKQPYDYQLAVNEFEREEVKEEILQNRITDEFSSPHFYDGNDNSDNSNGRMTPDEGSEGEPEEDLEYYFSCHERMMRDSSKGNFFHKYPFCIDGQESKCSSDVFKDINKDDLKDNFTAPELSRSTLVDQIDYDLDNFKVNESSIESSYISNQNVN